MLELGKAVGLRPHPVVILRAKDFRRLIREILEIKKGQFVAPGWSC